MSPLPPLKATLIWGHLAGQWHFMGQGDILGLRAHLRHKAKMQTGYFSEGLWPLFTLTVIRIIHLLIIRYFTPGGMGRKKRPNRD